MSKHEEAIALLRRWLAAWEGGDIDVCHSTHDPDECFRLARYTDAFLQLVDDATHAG